MAEKYSARNILEKTKGQQEVITQSTKEWNKTAGSQVKNSAVGRMSDARSGNRAPISPEELARREREANTKKIKYTIANKDIYEFTDEEKQLYIEFNPEIFSHADDSLGNCEFITTSSVAELVLSDYFVRKERTKGMNFLFNFHVADTNDTSDT